MNSLYPLKFKPWYRKMIWGGAKLRTILGKDLKFDDCGESWEISAVQGHLSVVSNGFLAGNNIQEIIEVYMGDLVGEAVYEKFGIEFPLLIKFIDSNRDLSIQVHPNDELAIKRHKAFGKTEMWYVLDAEPGSTLFSGFNQQLNRDSYVKHLNEGSILSILNEEKVSTGDVYYLPAGRVHALRSGILVLEIQQTSDITYRIYDWDRVDAEGKPRELHNELALDAIDFKHYDNYKVSYNAEKDKSTLLVKSDYFVTALLTLTKSVWRDYTLIDSFIILICVQGTGKIMYGKESISFGLGETILIPADLKEIEIIPELPMNILEVYAPTK
jgi:mannose-6-phosphate isomerase